MKSSTGEVHLDVGHLIGFCFRLQRVQGEFFAKSVDVLVADWDRGVELMVSTKAMVSSFGKNLTNRWEEFV